MKGSFASSAASFCQDIGQKAHSLETSVDHTPLRKTAQGPRAPWCSHTRPPEEYVHEAVEGAPGSQASRLPGSQAPKPSHQELLWKWLWLHWNSHAGRTGCEVTSTGEVPGINLYLGGGVHTRKCNLSTNAMSPGGPYEEYVGTSQSHGRRKGRRIGFCLPVIEGCPKCLLWIDLFHWVVHV